MRPLQACNPRNKVKLTRSLFGPSYEKALLQRMESVAPSFARMSCRCFPPVQVKLTYLTAASLTGRLHKSSPQQEKKRKKYTTPFSVNAMRSQILYRAAQVAASNMQVNTPHCDLIHVLTLYGHYMNIVLTSCVCKDATMTKLTRAFSSKTGPGDCRL